MLSAAKYLCYCASYILHYAQDDISAKEASIVVNSYITAQQKFSVDIVPSSYSYIIQQYLTLFIHLYFLHVFLLCSFIA